MLRDLHTVWLRGSSPLHEAIAGPCGPEHSGSIHLGQEYPPPGIHTCGGPRRGWVQAPWSHQAPPTLDRLWRSQSGLWLLAAEKAVYPGVWGAKGAKDHPRRIKTEFCPVLG